MKKITIEFTDDNYLRLLAYTKASNKFFKDKATKEELIGGILENQLCYDFPFDNSDYFFKTLEKLRTNYKLKK